jgi:hypothetical protein
VAGYKKPLVLSLRLIAAVAILKLNKITGIIPTTTIANAEPDASANLSSAARL